MATPNANSTIANTLSQGVSAHEEGRYQEAERCYRAILSSDPDHADANHNLGVLAVSFNQTEFALPLFKQALDTNPKVEQFWLSYADALAKTQQIDEAREILERGKNQGVAPEKVAALEVQLQSASQSKPPKAIHKSTFSEKRKKSAAGLIVSTSVSFLPVACTCC